MKNLFIDINNEEIEVMGMTCNGCGIREELRLGELFDKEVEEFEKRHANCEEPKK